MAYEDAQFLINDALFRAGEIPGSSDWDGKAVDYLNRGYTAICNGTSEFLPETVDDWWWMKSKGVLTLKPVFSTGTISIEEGSNTVEFSDAPSESVEDWRLKVTGHPDMFVVSSHTSMSTSAILDSSYTGPTSVAASFQLMKVTYDLGDVGAVISPMISYREEEYIYGVSPERLDFLYPLQRLAPGIPKAFSLMDDTTVRFSHGGRADGVSMRVEYRFKLIPPLLENAPDSIPVMPRQYRHVLADVTCFQIMFDKNDDRAGGMAQQVRGILKAMHAENKHAMKKMDNLHGHIMPRPGRSGFARNKLLRTESGLIIG